MQFTYKQYRRFRARQRNAVRRIAQCVKVGTIPMTPWAKDTIRRAREMHSYCVSYERTFGTRTPKQENPNA